MGFGNDGRMLALGFFLALAGGCFAGGFVQGLPCTSDADCGPQLQCMEGLCGGLGDPALCGNGLLDVGEECDDGALEDGDGCTPSCQRPVCGDGYLGPGEGCDDGNAADGDGCTATCQIPSTCGNGEAEPGEECDDGNLEDGDVCTSECRLPVCGDGFLGPGEACDDGNDLGTDGCTPTCMLPACGDGFVNLQEEACDDGNGTENDECTTNCAVSPEMPTLELSFAQVRQFEFSWEPAPGAEWYELYESTDEGKPFEQVAGEIVEPSYSLTVPLLHRVNASYKLRACNSLRCAESAEVQVTGNLAEAIGYFKASNTFESAVFGFSVAVSGDGTTLVVGAYGESCSATGITTDQYDLLAPNSGAAYVFTLTNGVWEQQAYIKASNTDTNDLFGGSVALSGDGHTLAVGALRESSKVEEINSGGQDDNSASAAGAVYVFLRTGEAWKQEAYIKAPNTDAGDFFGVALALSGDGDTLVVGADGEDSQGIGTDNGEHDDNSAPNSGAVYLMARNNGVWTHDTFVKASNTDSGDHFGSSVALSGDGQTLAVGASQESSNGDQDNNDVPIAGAVYVFARTGDTWKQESYLKASNAGAEDRFGESVGLSADGSTLAVGAFSEGSSAKGVNSEEEDDNSASGAGAVYVFTRAENMWAQEAYIKASNTSEGNRFGTSVSLSGDGLSLAVGSRLEQSSAVGLNGAEGSSPHEIGAAYLFMKADGSWQQEAYIKPPVPGFNFEFGMGIQLSGDGETLVVGAPGESGGSTGVDGDPYNDAWYSSGAAYVY